MTRSSRGLRLLPALALILVLVHPRDAAAAFDEVISSLREMVSDFLNDEASGEGGYFEKLGVIALTPEDRRKQQAIVRRLKRYEP